LGIGINLNTKNFPQQLREIAGSIGAECDPNKLIADIVNELFKFLYGKADFMTEYRKRSMVLGKTVLCTRGNESYLGVAEQITDKGALLVRCTNGDLICMDSGEISLRLTETSV
jgi:BirA family biotin operon repressor/biotin-[acetyl-CoA-carboxylase] ligase